MTLRIALHHTTSAVVLALALAGPARAACPTQVLTSGTAVPVSSTPALCQFAQSSAFWTAVAVRPQPGADWDLFLYSGTTPEPSCTPTGLLASSTAGVGVLDFVVGDFNHNAPGTYYPSVSRYSGGNATVQWDDGPDVIVPNGSAISGSMATSDLIRVWDVYMSTGTTYTFDFFPTNWSGAHLMLFANITGGTYWAGRSAAHFDVTGTTTFTPTTTGYYGLVLTNDAGTALSYKLGVTASTCPIPSALTAQTPVVVALPNGNLAFEARDPFWMGCAVRSSAADWDLGLYDMPSGGSPPTCFDGLFATSGFGPGSVDLTVGDFSFSPAGWYFVYPHLFSGAAAGEVEFTGTQGILETNSLPHFESMAGSDLADFYDVYLHAGHTYRFILSLPIGRTLLLFANSGGGAYFAGRSAAVLSSPGGGAGPTTYTAPVSGWYGVAVVNDAAVAGDYSVTFGDCSFPTALSPGVTASTGMVMTAYFSIAQTARYWTAAALRGESPEWVLNLNGDNLSSLWPSCTTLPFATSYGVPSGRQPVVVGDFNYNTPGTYYLNAAQPRAESVSSTAVQWDSGENLIIANDNNVTQRTTGPDDVVGCWDVYLEAGQAYEFELSSGPAASLTLMLFRNETGYEYWAGRQMAEFESGAGAHTYTAPSSGFYGVVVVNENGAADAYTIRVRTCPPIVSLTPGPAFIVPTEPRAFVSFAPALPYWTAIAAAGLTSSSDWSLYAYSSPTGGAIGTCLSGMLANSTMYPEADVVVGDFNFNSFATYYASAIRWTGADAGLVEYFPGHQELTLDAPDNVRTTTSDFLVESWDAPMIAGQTYTLTFSHSPGLDAKVLVFAPTGGPLWTGRASALVESQQSVVITAPVTGWYGVVVVRDGGAGIFEVGLRSGTVTVEGTPRPDRDALGGISPNPGRGALRIDYALRAEGEVAFDVLDMAGRRVASVEPGARSAGEWSASWRPADASGRRLAAGLYFVRMRLGDRVVGTRKLTLLE